MALLVLLVTASTARCIGLWFASEDSGSSQQTIGRWEWIWLWCY